MKKILFALTLLWSFSAFANADVPEDRVRAVGDR